MFYLIKSYGEFPSIISIVNGTNNQNKIIEDIEIIFQTYIIDRMKSSKDKKEYEMLISMFNDFQKFKQEYVPAQMKQVICSPTISFVRDYLINKKKYTDENKKGIEFIYYISTTGITKITSAECWVTPDAKGFPTQYTIDEKTFEVSVSI